MNSGEKPGKTGQLSVLPFDPADLTSLRVNQAGWARMTGFSRQYVSQLVKQGKISTFPDGTIDPQRAYREYLLNSDPGRMRSKMLKPITEEMDILRAVNADLAHQLKNRHHALQSVLELLAEQAAWLDAFFESLLTAGDTLSGCSSEDEREDLLQSLFDAAGDTAMCADPATALARVDDDIAALYQPPTREPGEHSSLQGIGGRETDTGGDQRNDGGETAMPKT